ncbi:MAG TPA: 2'-5' RNA ligase [Cyanobacteria bacterium UBA11149]|nr:2'-5' RNA ligase [Cyanobacteria bacterium UBA11367]HBE58878.1 2'-5' RNA ligase [Cyanobacteria bacterium UBA11366]HBK62517.1 2'-5' RNA ligase [Cyanobacteria bacterium UBA11166]HBR75823.1 2'-5' RNA ligase [Cyanobacteria bacterium UBA11159]HBS72314.1 2'-5' RNA ligase [Cyanobacteria bacterium UBA11153]HBW91148.1 2'-5' RNA ligase [Cyanobacteria bacterium UBA11149]HCA94391.1 2'-5' RNA ligase [Cyanobacteria bacterium UBA9226]
MSNDNQLFFIALLPPQEVQEYANNIKQYFAQNYHSQAAFKAPPHITLQPPFKWQVDDMPTLEQSLSNFAKNQNPVPIILKGFGAFKPKVIYINVIKTPELMMVQQYLMKSLEESLGILSPDSEERSFSPHITVAYRDLTKDNFRAAWPEFKQRELEFRFTVSQLTLLVHDREKRWNVKMEFPFVF